MTGTYSFYNVVELQFYLVAVARAISVSYDQSSSTKSDVFGSSLSNFSFITFSLTINGIKTVLSLCCNYEFQLITQEVECPKEHLKIFEFNTIPFHLILNPFCPYLRRN